MHERVTFRIPQQQLDELDRLVEEGVYPNRSEAIRDAVRDITESGSTPEYLDSREAQQRVRAQTDD